MIFYVIPHFNDDSEVYNSGASQNVEVNPYWVIAPILALFLPFVKIFILDKSKKEGM